MPLNSEESGLRQALKRKIGFPPPALRDFSSPGIRSRGFTLVEMMVVIGIILFLALITIPNVLRARIDSNEAVAISSLRTLYSALEMYYMNNDYVYPEGLTGLIPPASNPGYIDPELAGGSKLGYLYNYTYVDEDTFHINADPRSAGKTGIRHFYMDETGKVRADPNQAADGNDPVIQ